MPPTGEMGPQVQNKQAKHLKVDPSYAQTISVKIPDKLFKVSQKTVQKHDVYKLLKGTVRTCSSQLTCSVVFILLIVCASGERLFP